jgi:hypothetical protein
MTVKVYETSFKAPAPTNGLAPNRELLPGDCPPTSGDYLVTTSVSAIECQVKRVMLLTCCDGDWSYATSAIDGPPDPVDAWIHAPLPFCPDSPETHEGWTPRGREPDRDGFFMITGLMEKVLFSGEMLPQILFLRFVDSVWILPLSCKILAWRECPSPFFCDPLSVSSRQVTLESNKSTAPPGLP